MHAKSGLEPTPPIGVIDCFGKGFETVVSQIALISIPILLDLFLWLGPRLSVSSLFGNVGNIVAAGNDVPAESVRAIELSFNSLAESLNLFSFLSTSPLGVPSMMVSKVVLLSPLGEVLLIPVTSWFTLSIITVVINLAGLFLGVLYFAFIARGTLPDEFQQEDMDPLARAWIYWVRLVGFAVAVLAAMIAFGFAISMLAGLASIVHTSISGLVVSLGVAVWVWGLFFVAFTVHGIVVDNYTVNVAVRNSLLIVRLNMPSVVGLFSLIILLLWGLGYLWTMPSSESWVLMVGIVAHSFVATGLYASTFHFYRDRLRWCDELQRYEGGKTEVPSGVGATRLRGKKSDSEEHKEEDKKK